MGDVVRNESLYQTGRLWEQEAGVAADPLLFDDWFDAIEDGLRARIRDFIETMLEGVGDRLFTFTRFPYALPATPSSVCTRSSSTKSRLQTILPCAETAAMLFRALLASGQIVMRKVDGWRSLAEKPSDQIIDLAV